MHVEKGQQLYQIDEARYLAQLNSAKADLKSVEANLKTLEAKARRYDDLVAQNAVSGRRKQQREAQMQKLRDSLEAEREARATARACRGYRRNPYF